MQVLFGAEPQTLSGVFATTGRVIKRSAKTTGRVIGKGAKTTMRVTGKAVNAIVPLAPAIAFVPGVGPAAAGGIAAAKGISSLIPKKKKPGPTVKPKSRVQTSFSVIKAPDSIKKSMGKKSGFLPSVKSPFPGISFPGLNIPGFPGGGGGGAVSTSAEQIPQKSFIEKNWPLMAGGAAVLFLLMRKK